jgi:hypothetical protein
MNIALSRKPPDDASIVFADHRRAPLQGDIRLIVEVRHFGVECPPGKHTHDDEVKVWAR